ncbi:MAG: permease [Chloroflexi bacterium]|nr:permease [Chloroflexota bacterium]
MDTFLELCRGGLAELLDYMLAHFITCLVPAFFIAGAISMFVSQGAVLKYFGPNANKLLSYSVGSVSGAVLSVCSCTVLPLFAGIYRRGAGLGPAVAFLYSAPAINVLAIVWTARILGFDLGVGRAIGAIIFSIVIGAIMARVFCREEQDRCQNAFDELDTSTWLKGWQTLIFMAALVGFLISLAWGFKVHPVKDTDTWKLIIDIGIEMNWVAIGFTVFFAIVIAEVLRRWFTREMLSEWFRSTWSFFKLIAPWLLGGIIAAGMINVVLPEDWVERIVGGDSLSANFIASVVGALLYLATLTEVPILRTFIDAGMGSGPALALLLSGPALSLPAMFTLRNIMGTKKMLTYVSLVVVMAAGTGLVFGRIVT